MLYSTYLQGCNCFLYHHSNKNNLAATLTIKTDIITVHTSEKIEGEGEGVAEQNRVIIKLIFLYTVLDSALLLHVFKAKFL